MLYNTVFTKKFPNLTKFNPFAAIPVHCADNLHRGCNTQNGDAATGWSERPH